LSELDTAGTSRTPVVVLVTIDALRAEVLSSGVHDAQLPNLARLRDAGAYFERAVAPGAQTSVSLSTMFSGRYFSQLRWSFHGRGKTRFQYAHADTTERFPTALARGDVASSSYLSLVFLAGDFGIARGFEHEHAIVSQRNHGRAQQMMGPLLADLRATKQGPHLFYVHLMEPHAPYDRGRARAGSQYERYISEIALVDKWLGKLRRVLARHHRGRAYLIVSADHGEAFGEHGTQFHTKTLYEELVHVPLIVWGRGIAPQRVHQRVSLVDVGPTLLQLFRLPPQPHAMGHSLLPLIRKRLADLPRPVVAEGRLRRAYYSGSLKVIEDTVRKTVEVFDLDEDPGELDNLFDRYSAAAPEHPRRALMMKAIAEQRAFFAEHTLRVPAGYEPPYKP